MRLACDGLIAGLEPGTFDAARFRSAVILLTKREIQLARLAAMGWSNAQIATELVLSVRTVESYLHRIMKETSTASRRDQRARRFRLVGRDEERCARRAHRSTQVSAGAT